MSYEEKGTWVYLVTSAGAYTVYLAIVLGRVLRTPVADVPYISCCCGRPAPRSSRRSRAAPGRDRSPSDSRRSDVRDKEISRFGEHASRWFVVAGAGAALCMAMARRDYFWIANVLYLGFVLWAIAGSVLKLVAYRRGL